MSDTQVTTVFKTTDWNALIDQVKVLVNANPGCVSAAPPTDAVDPHVWTLQDVLGIQQVLQQLCNTDTFTTPVGPENLWLQKIIDEINTAIKNGACSCQECIKTCNPGVKNVDFSITQSGCEDMPIDLNAPDPTKQTRDAQNAAGLIGQKADGACSDYIDGFASYCGLQQRIKCAKLWLAQYQQETGPTKDADIAIAQAQIQRLTTQADAAKTTYQAAMASANSYAAACLAAMNAIDFYPNGSISLMKYVPKTPWATPDCANTPSWGTADPSACSVVAWQLGYPTPPGQTTGTGVSGIIGVGKFSPDGTPYVTGVVGSQVLSLSTACCAAWNGAGTGCATMLSLVGPPLRCQWPFRHQNHGLASRAHRQHYHHKLPVAGKVSQADCTTANLNDALWKSPTKAMTLSASTRPKP